MVDVDDILRTAIEKDASDVHLISGIRPMLRIARHLTPYEGCDNLTPEDMADIYDYFIRGNIDKDAVFTQTKKLDSSFEFNGLRFRVNISLSGDVPVFTLRLIKNLLKRRFTIRLMPIKSMSLPMIKKANFQKKNL